MFAKTLKLLEGFPPGGFSCSCSAELECRKVYMEMQFKSPT